MTDRRLKRAVFHTLAYADVFDYPLTAREIQRYLPGESCLLEEVERALEQAYDFTKIQDWYCLPGRERTVAIRAQRAALARALWPRALWYGARIASLPYVRMVAVTGSLAMDNAEAGEDIDYMIVVRPGYVWTCRALILLVGRLARLQGITLCPNYLISENALELPDRSYYAARELAQMVPISGLQVYEQIRAANRWTDAYLPNARGGPEKKERVKHERLASSIQKVLEAALRLVPMRLFEAFEMRRKIRRLQEQQRDSSEAFFSADVCKGHADRHGERTQRELDRRKEALGIEALTAMFGADD